MHSFKLPWCNIIQGPFTLCWSIVLDFQYKTKNKSLFGKLDDMTEYIWIFIDLADRNNNGTFKI